MPRAGSMIWWRFKGGTGVPWKFGYVTYIGSGLARLGVYNGDTHSGMVVHPDEIEWRYRE